MRPITKGLLGLVAVIALLQAGLVVSMMWPLEPLSSVMRTHWFWFRLPLLILSAIVAVAGLTTLLIALFRRSTTKDLRIKGNRGELVVTKSAVERGLVTAIARDHEVQQVEAKVKMKGNRVTEAKIRAGQLQLADAQGLAEAIEATATKQLKQMLGVDVAKVRVRLHNTPSSKSVPVI